jgi:hypothetical protein
MTQEGDFGPESSSNDIESEKSFTQTYVDLYRDCVLSVDHKIEEVKDRNKPNELTSDVFAYSFFDRDIFYLNGQRLQSPKFNESPIYIPDGEVITIEEARRRFPDMLLIFNKFERYNIDEVVLTRLDTIVLKQDNIVVL